MFVPIIQYQSTSPSNDPYVLASRNYPSTLWIKLLRTVRVFLSIEVSIKLCNVSVMTLHSLTSRTQFSETEYLLTIISSIFEAVAVLVAGCNMVPQSPLRNPVVCIVEVANSSPLELCHTWKSIICLLISNLSASIAELMVSNAFSSNTHWIHVFEFPFARMSNLAMIWLVIIRVVKVPSPCSFDTLQHIFSNVRCREFWERGSDKQHSSICCPSLVTTRDPPYTFSMTLLLPKGPKELNMSISGADSILWIS